MVNLGCPTLASIHSGPALEVVTGQNFVSYASPSIRMHVTVVVDSPRRIMRRKHLCGDWELAESLTPVLVLLIVEDRRRFD
jgi:hypothetical protein